jgi:uncharacterized protein (TIGR02569 family)
MSDQLVPAHVLAAFGVDAHDLEALDGGQGSSMRVGDLVLKPYADDVETTWVAGLAARTSGPGFHLPAPVPALDGRWTVDGWAAVEHVAGEAEPAGRWSEVVAAGRAFHAAVAGEPMPEHLPGRTHRWAVADRVAWEEEPAPPLGPRSRPLLAELEALRRPVDLRPQLVHGDLSGNVLLAPDRDPAIIDLSPYWRPAAYADAVIVVDALLSWSEPDTLVGELAPHHLPRGDWHQLLVRAAIFRLVSLDEANRPGDPDVAEQLPAYVQLVGLLGGAAV